MTLIRLSLLFRNELTRGTLYPIASSQTRIAWRTLLGGLMFIETVVQLGCQTVPGAPSEKRRPTVLIVEDTHDLAHAFDPICSYLGIQVETPPAGQSLVEALLAHHPMAVIAEFEGGQQDGCHVLRVVADYDPTLPCLLLTGGDPRLAGAADAVEELWGLTQVHKLPGLSSLADIVEFLFHAGRKGECMRLLCS